MAPLAARLRLRLAMEESDTSTHKVSDSGYSNSCNSQSQRSSGSSKSRHSNSSGGSSGYGGHPSTVGSGGGAFPQPPAGKRKDKEHKKKKLKGGPPGAAAAAGAGTGVAAAAGAVIPGAEPRFPETSLSLAPGPAAAAPAAAEAGGGGVADSGAGPPGTGAAPAPAAGTGALPPLLAPPGPALPPVRPARPPPPAAPATDRLPAVSAAAAAAAAAGLEPASAASAPPPAPARTLGCPAADPPPPTGSEFSAVVSLREGVVLYTTASLGSVLGFPKDMWLGRSFIDFVHPKDRVALTAHIGSSVAEPAEEGRCPGGLYCCLRQYRGLRGSGYGVTDKPVAYLPFHLTLTCREVAAGEQLGLQGVEPALQGLFLIIYAVRVKPAYLHAGETKVSPKFLTRHQTSCHLSHVDSAVVPHLGYLPHDMVGRSVFEFYHPEDLPFLKEVYEAVMKEQGHTFRSKPYRFRSQNGGYVLLDTEWSAFISPWSRKLEFIIGQHRVLKGPSNPDVFSAPKDEDGLQISEEVLKESKVIQEEIESLLREPVQRSSEVARQQTSKRCKDLACFMESLMDEVTRPGLRVDLPPEEQSFSERDSVMLGEISPHHDYYDSKSSSETPPSYNQLNYNENIQRFFESKPKTTLSDESGESKTEANRSLNSTDEEGKSMPVADSSLDSSNRKCCSPVNGSGSGSGGSSGSAGIPGSAASRGDTSATHTSHDSYQPPHLTEALLSRHNEDMEKIMVQRHREQRTKGGDREGKKKLAHEKLQEPCHGIKRSGSHSWEGEPCKASKHPHVDSLPVCAASGGGVGVGPGAGPLLYPSSPSVNLWPPFSVTVTPLHTSQPCLAHSGYGGGGVATPPPPLASMIPVYYISAGPPQPAAPLSAPPASETLGLLPPGPAPAAAARPFLPQQVPLMSPLLYQPMQPLYGRPPLVYPSVMLQPSALLPTPLILKQEKPLVEGGAAGCIGPGTNFQRPASQATSVKAEPGSAMSSIASASIKRAMSECSKKDKSLCSPGAHTSCPEASPDEDLARDRGTGFSTTGDLRTTTGDDSSYSSFYSFLHTERSDESMRSSLNNGKEYPSPSKTEDMMWENSEINSLLSPGRHRPVLKDPPWLEDVKVTPDLVYRYQMDNRNLANVLDSDLAALKRFQQPVLVNDQLSQLYLDMELEGLSTQLRLEEGLTCSSGGSGGSSGGEELVPSAQGKKKRHSSQYGKLVMIFEENAPLPPPASDLKSVPSTETYV